MKRAYSRIKSELKIRSILKLIMIGQWSPTFKKYSTILITFGHR